MRQLTDKQMVYRLWVNLQTVIWKDFMKFTQNLNQDIDKWESLDEFQTGKPNEEYIIRYEDDYGRKND